MLLAMSDARNSAASAQSSAVIGRPNGCIEPTASPISSPMPSEPTVGVRDDEVRERHPGGADRVHANAERRALDGDPLVIWFTAPLVAP